MSELLKTNKIILILIASILFTSSTLMHVASARTNTSLTIAVTSPPLGIPFSSEFTIEAILKDENGNPVPNIDIYFLNACDDHTHQLGKAKTDSNGVASLKYTPFVTSLSLISRTVKYEVKAVFNGNSNYSSSSSEYIEIVIVDYSPYLVDGGIITVATIGVVGYIVFRRGKEQSLSQ